MVLVVPEQSQRPYRFGMTLLCVGALFNWLGLADTYSDPVPAIRYIGVGLIAAGASLICMAMCFWMRNIHDPNLGSEFEVSADPVHVIAVDPSLEKPPDYSTVVDVPPCYEDAIKLHSATTVAVHTLKHITTPTDPSAAVVEASGKNTVNAERNNVLQSSQSCDHPDFSAATSQRRHSEKSEQETCQNSSQSGNTLANVLRKSIRGIRRLRSSSEDNNHSNAQTSNVENGTVERVCTTPAAKSDR